MALLQWLQLFRGQVHQLREDLRPPEVRLHPVRHPRLQHRRRQGSCQDSLADLRDGQLLFLSTIYPNGEKIPNDQKITKRP
jgi:hypothetical protein